MLQIQNLEKKLKDFTLKIDSLTINNNDYFVILGLSGSGKTTLLELIAGFNKADKGKILLNGEDITNAPINKRNIVLCNGKYLFPHLTVKENIKLGYSCKKKTKQELIDENKIINELCNSLKITHILDRYPKNLSMGERQRVALAMALITNPKIILLDEPLCNLDRLIHEELLEELRNLYEKLNKNKNNDYLKTIFIHVTHDFNEAIALSTKTAIMKNGIIEQIGTIEEILKYPKTEFVAKFTQLKNILKGELIKTNNNYYFKNNNITINLNLNKSPTDNNNNNNNIKIGIRSEDIMIINNCNCESIHKNIFSGKIINMIPSGLSTYKLNIKVNELILICEVVKCQIDKMNLKVGKNIKFCINSVILLE